MRRFQELLACPACGAGLEPTAGTEAGPHACSGCGVLYSRPGGLWVLLPGAGRPTDATAKAFAAQWQLQDRGTYEAETIYGETAAEELASCLARFGIATPEALAGKSILDVGCGSGRLTANLAQWAPRALVVGGERSEAVAIAHRRCSGRPNAVVAQLDLHAPPFRPASFDYVYADGVLPHVPDPEAALAHLDRLLRPGGKLFVWIYPRRFSPYRLLRDALVRPHAWPPRALRAVEWFAGVPLWAAFKLYEPARGSRRRSLREVLFMLHDNLVPEFQHRRHPHELVDAFRRLGYVDVACLPPDTGVVGTKGDVPGGELEP